jgi:hypothetical protein
MAFSTFQRDQNTRRMILQQFQSLQVAPEAVATACAANARSALACSGAPKVRRPRLGGVRPGSLHSSVPPRGSRHQRRAESDVRRMAPAKSFTPKQGPVSGFHLRIHAPARPAAGRSRNAAIFPGQRPFSSPDGAHARTGRVHSAPTGGRSQHRNAH